MSGKMNPAHRIGFKESMNYSHRLSLSARQMRNERVDGRNINIEEADHAASVGNHFAAIDHSPVCRLAPHKQIVRDVARAHQRQILVYGCNAQGECILGARDLYRGRL